MARQEFLEALARALCSELTEQEVQENIRYYDDYISREINGGRNEAQVLSELGDPRLIARTILQVDQQKDEAQSYDGAERTVYAQTEDGAFEEAPEDGRAQKDGYRFSMQASGMRGWLILLAVVAVIFLVLGATFVILWRLLPVILVIGAAMWIYRRFFS